MELVTELVNNQLTLCLPVALVLIGAILVFAFGFKSAEQPPFDKLSSNINDDRKQAGKKRKTKEKKPTVNGHIVNADKSPTKRSTPETPNSAAKQKRSEPVKNKKSEETKTKKIVKGKSNEKPVDFDDGNWETVPTKGDKKKKQDSPVKKDRKVKKVDDAVVVTEKLETDAPIEEVPIKVDDEEIPVAAEDDQKEIILEPIEPEPEIIEPIEEVVTKPVKQVKTVEGGVAFDELGDMWTDAKLAKKSKKKSRRDN